MKAPLAPFPATTPALATPSILVEFESLDERLRACNLVRVALDFNKAQQLSDVVDVADALGRKMARSLKATPVEVLRDGRHAVCRESARGSTSERLKDDNTSSRVRRKYAHRVLRRVRSTLRSELALVRSRDHTRPFVVAVLRAELRRALRVRRPRLRGDDTRNQLFADDARALV